MDVFLFCFLVRLLACLLVYLFMFFSHHVSFIRDVNCCFVKIFGCVFSFNTFSLSFPTHNKTNSLSKKLHEKKKNLRKMGPKK